MFLLRPKEEIRELIKREKLFTLSDIIALEDLMRDNEQRVGYGYNAERQRRHDALKKVIELIK